MRRPTESLAIPASNVPVHHIESGIASTPVSVSAGIFPRASASSTTSRSPRANARRKPWQKRGKGGDPLFEPSGPPPPGQHPPSRRRRAPRLAAGDRIPHVPAERNAPAAPVALGDPAALPLEGHAVEVRAPAPAPLPLQAADVPPVYRRVGSRGLLHIRAPRLVEPLHAVPQIVPMPEQ